MDILIDLGKIAGIAGISVGVLAIIFRQIIAKKIFPQLTKEQAYKILRLIITLLFVIGIFGILSWTLSPIIKNLTINTSATNPFGDSEILIDETQLFFSQDKFKSSANDLTVKESKYLFQIDKPSKDGFKAELISAKEYAETFYKGAGKDLGFQLIEDAKVFRIYWQNPIELGFTSKTYEGEKVSNKVFKEAWTYYTGEPLEENSEELFNPLDIDSLLNSAEFLEEIEDLESDTSEFSESSQRAARAFRQVIHHKNTMHNELAIVIFDKKNYEKTLIASQNGRKVVPNPLNFLFAAGGTLPKIDILSVNQASVSKNNKVWGFYGQRKFNNISVNGKEEDELYMDFYRIYTMNSAFIYQMTLTYISTPNTPRTVWNDLTGCLKTLKIVE